MKEQERLEEIDALVDDLANSKIDLREFIQNHFEQAEEKIELQERVKELENRNKELEYASMHNGELNEFLQKRNLPPNTLGRHVVDVVMDYVEESEKEIQRLEKIYRPFTSCSFYGITNRKGGEKARQALRGDKND